MSYLTSLFTLQGKTVAFTGATGVLGSQLALDVAKAGAKLALIGRNAPRAQRVALRIKEIGGEAAFFQADVTDENRLKEVKNEILERYGNIDILINGAGGNLPNAIQAPNQSFFSISTQGFAEVIHLNLMASVLTSHVFGQEMAKNGKGIIVNISSVAAEKPLTRVGGYGAAKAALSHFTQWLATDVAKKYGEGIRVNAIMPGFFLTEQNKTLLTTEEGTPTERGQEIIRQVPFARFGRPEELSGTLIWLCSPASAFVTGAVVPVDGGFLAFGGI
jgi:NAD(P)-dependent dehydrogenase (short-subunit alcohol dehydrogenase family)